MKFADSVKQNANLTSTATITPGAAAVGFRTWAQVIADTAGKPEQVAIGDTVCMRVDDVTDPSKWEVAEYTIGGTAQVPTLTRTKIDTSSAGGTTPITFGGPVTVLCTVPSNYLVGTPLADYLAANPGSTPQGSDMIPLIQGNGLVGNTLSAIASMILKLWPTVAASVITSAVTGAITLDFTTHHRKRIFLTAAPSAVNGPAVGQFGNLGNGFECELVNVSGSAIPLGASGVSIVGLPSGSSIPVGGVVRIFTGNGTIYANLNTATASAPAATETLTINTIGTPQVVGTVFSVSGTWTGVKPTGLNFALIDNGGTQGAFNTATGAVINDNGTWTFNQNPASASTSRTMVVQDSGHISIVSAPSNAYVVNAAAGGGTGGTSSATAPFTVTAQGGSNVPYGACVAAMRTFDGDYFNRRITPTGTATIVSVNSALFESNTVVPTSTVVPNSAAGSRGVWLGSTINYGNSGNWLNVGGGGTQGLNGVGADYPTEVDFYLWTFVTDSNGITWKFVSTFRINVMNGNSKVLLAADSVLTAVA